MLERKGVFEIEFVNVQSEIKVKQIDSTEDQ
jgi:hypothetical protein